MSKDKKKKKQQNNVVSMPGNMQIYRLIDQGFSLKIERNREGALQLKENLFNAVQLLKYEEQYKGTFQYDSFCRTIFHNPPNTDDEWVKIQDIHIFYVQLYFQDRYDCAFSDKILWSAIDIVSRETKKDPLVDYFENLPQWNPKRDKALCERLFVDYFKAKDTPLNRAYSLKFCISVVARIFATIDHPTKCDTMPVLYGDQGIKKSTALERLCFYKHFGRRYFGDTPLQIENAKDSVMSITGKAIYEMKELARRTKDRQLEKSWLDHQIDEIRKPYKREIERIVRRCVFIATTNRSQVLSDSTGSRRFWVIEVGTELKPGEKIDTDKIEKIADLIWAEAYYRYNNDEDWWLSDAEEKLRRESAEDYTAQHPLTDSVMDIVRSLNKSQTPVTVSTIIRELWEESNPMKADSKKYLDKSTRRTQAIIADILRSKGLKYVRISVNGEQIRCWMGAK